MAILNLVRDYGVSPCIVRMLTDDDLATITTAGYLDHQMVSFNRINGGAFQWDPTDVILCNYDSGFGFFILSADFSTLIPFSNDIPTGIADSVLVTDNSGSELWRGPLTNGQLIIGSTGATPVAASLTAGSGVTITPGAGSITISATGGGGGIATIDGDSGSITGGTVTIDTELSSVNSGSTFSFINSGSKSTLNVTDANFNTLIGSLAGNLTLSGASNTGFGKQVLASCAGGSGNTAIGDHALPALTSGNYNVVLGHRAGLSLAEGTFNVYAGFEAGKNNTTTDSGNIYFNAGGVTGESNCLRIGAATAATGQALSTAFICGINGNTLSGTPLVVTIDSSTNQLGVAAFPSGGSVSIAGDSGSISGSSLTIYSNRAANNSGATLEFVNSGTVSSLNVTDSDSNTLVGKLAGNLTLSGSNNHGFGYHSLNALTTGGNNHAFGYETLFNCTTGTNNTAIGLQALTSLVDGAGNLAIGQSCLSSSVSDQNNTAIGSGALGSLNGGDNNTAIGSQAGSALTTGASNVYLNSQGASSESHVLRIGAGTGSGSQQLTTAFICGINGNTLGGTPLVVTIDSTSNQLGVAAFPSGGSVSIAGDSGSISGSSLTIFSDKSSVNAGSSVSFVNSSTTSTFNLTDSNNNTLLGKSVGNLTMSGSANVGVGILSLGALTNGSSNVGIGFNVLAHVQDGVQNIAIGTSALNASVSDSDNIAIGYNALNLNNGGSGNIGFGSNSLAVNVTANQNLAIGNFSLKSLTGGDGQNVGVGFGCLFASTTDDTNTAIGNYALTTLNGGSKNVAIGQSAGNLVVTGSFNLFLGRNAGTSYTGAESSNVTLNSNGVVGESNCLRIGEGTGTADHQLTTAFISGINGNTVSNTMMVTIDSTTNQLGTAAVPGGGGGLTWVDVTGGTQTIAASSGYVSDNATQVVYTLPATPIFGDIFTVTGGVSGNATTNWKIEQNAGQQINMGNLSTTVGTGGWLEATLQYDTVSLVCVVAGASAVWVVTSSMGNITVI